MTVQGEPWDAIRGEYDSTRFVCLYFEDGKPKELPVVKSGLTKVEP